MRKQTLTEVLLGCAYKILLLSKVFSPRGWGRRVWFATICVTEHLANNKEKGFSQLPWFQRTAKSTYIHLPSNQLLKSSSRRNPCNIYLFLLLADKHRHISEDPLKFLLSSCFELSSEDMNKISYSNHRDYKRLILLTLATQTALSGDLVPQPRGELNSNPSCHASPIFFFSLNIISQKAAWVQCTRVSYCAYNSLRRCILVHCALVTLPYKFPYRLQVSPELVIVLWSEKTAPYSWTCASSWKKNKHPPNLTEFLNI